MRSGADSSSPNGASRGSENPCHCRPLRSIHASCSSARNSPRRLPWRHTQGFAQTKTKPLSGLERVQLQLRRQINGSVGNLCKPSSNSDPRPVGQGSALYQNARAAVGIRFRLQPPKEFACRALAIRRRKGATKGGMQLIGIGEVPSHLLASQIEMKSMQKHCPPPQGKESSANARNAHQNAARRRTTEVDPF